MRPVNSAQVRMLTSRTSGLPRRARIWAVSISSSGRAGNEFIGSCRGGYTAGSPACSGNPAAHQAARPPSSSRTSATPASISRWATRPAAAVVRPYNTTVLPGPIPRCSHSVCNDGTASAFHKGGSSTRSVSMYPAPAIWPPQKAAGGPVPTSNRHHAPAGACSTSCPAANRASHTAVTRWRARGRSWRNRDIAAALSLRANGDLVETDASRGSIAPEMRVLWLSCRMRCV